MKRKMYSVALALLLGGVLSGCASTPTRTSNVCAVLDQKNGFFNSWERQAKTAERKYGIPMPIILATVNTESGYQHNARPARKKLLGFIPWKRPSTAYGYSQALNGTWEHYKKATGNWGASRSNFGDAADFIGWFHRESVRRNGVSPNDAYSLYLNYYLGHNAYAKGARGNATAVQGAQRTDTLARRYDQQLRSCGRR